MNIVARNIVAVIVGVFVGSAVNMSIIMISGSIIPPPEGVDITRLQASMHLMEPKHFIFPFFAHALGAFTGGLITALTSVTHRLRLALLVGLMFLAGGIANAFMLSSPLWFNILDLVFAYLPFSYLAARIVLHKRKIVGQKVSGEV